MNDRNVNYAQHHKNKNIHFVYHKDPNLDMTGIASAPTITNQHQRIALRGVGCCWWPLARAAVTLLLHDGKPACLPAACTQKPSLHLAATSPAVLGVLYTQQQVYLLTAGPLRLAQCAPAPRACAVVPLLPAAVLCGHPSRQVTVRGGPSCRYTMC
jgi:hypothetical protein